MKKEFLISLLIFIPLAAILSYINYYDSTENNLAKAILFGCLGATGIFFVPYFVRKFNKTKQK